MTDADDIFKIVVVIFGIIVLVSGFADIASLSLTEQIIENAFGLMGTGVLKIIVGGILVLAVVCPDAIGDFIRAVTGGR